MFIAHWIHRLPWRRQQAPVLAHQRLAEPQADEDRPLGCGWFDSSHDLQQGLVVQVAEPPALAALPLMDWLSLHTAGLQCPETCLDGAQGMMRALSCDQGSADEECMEADGGAGRPGRGGLWWRQ